MDKKYMIQFTHQELVSLAWLLANLYHHDTDFNLDKPDNWEEEGGGKKELWAVLGRLGIALGAPDDIPMN